MGPHEFLEALFDGAPSEEREIVLFAGRASSWHTSTESAVAAIAQANETSDVYFGVALQHRMAALDEAARRAGTVEPPPLRRVRGYASTATVLGGLWLDVDWADPSHQKKSLPPTRAAALALLHALPALPSCILDTGGGFHAWWIFNEPWELRDHAARIRAATLAKAWQAVAHHAASEHDWKLDATHDLARVLRLPGTVSRKHGGREITVESFADMRWEPDDFWQWAPDGIGVSSLEEPTVPISSIQLNPDAEPPATKLMALMSMSAMFSKTWRRLRTDLPSQSEYDLSIASQLVAMDWKDQEIVNALVAHRREGGGKPKLRAKYYGDTLQRARAGAQARDTFEDLAEEVRGAQEAIDAGSPDEPTTREKLLANISSQLEVRIVSVIKFQGDPPSFRLVLEDGALELGSVSKLLRFGSFQTAVAAINGKVLAPMKPAEWAPIAQALLAACEVQDIGPAGSIEGEVQMWLREYISTRGVADCPEEGISGRMPFRDRSGRLCMQLEPFLQWLRFSQSERAPNVNVSKRMRIFGAEPITVNVHSDDTKSGWTTRRAWFIPQPLLDREEEVMHA